MMGERVVSRREIEISRSTVVTEMRWFEDGGGRGRLASGFQRSSTHFAQHMPVGPLFMGPSALILSWRLGVLVTQQALR